MSKNNPLTDFMKQHLDEYLFLLEQAVSIETPSEGNKEYLENCRIFFEKLFTGIGFNCTVISSNNEKYGNHMYMEYGTGSEQLLFVGHYDTVYPNGTFGPKLFRIEGNKAYGPGIYDMKGGILQAYMAAKALIELSLLPPEKKLAFFLSCDEETGSISSYMHYAQYARLSKAALVFEPASSENIGDMNNGRLGRGYYTVIAKGKTAHSGQEPEKAESGLIELANQAIALEKLTDMKKVITVACTSLSAGHSGWCTVPGDAALTFDFRCSTPALAEEYNRKFQNLTPFNSNVTLTTLGSIDKPVFDQKNPGNMALYAKAAEIAKEYGFTANPVLGHGGSDGNFTSSAGCPTLDGLCLCGGGIHQPNSEYILIDSIVPKCAFTAALILAI